jgi:hypothetical protein
MTGTLRYSVNEVPVQDRSPHFLSRVEVTGAGGERVCIRVHDRAVSPARQSLCVTRLALWL